MDILQKESLQNGFSFDRLRSLLAVHEAGYIANAEGKDRVRANMISRQIGELEKFFGTTLRSKKGKLATLNEEGAELAKITKTFLHSLGDFMDRVDGKPATLSIGTGSSIIETLLLPQLKQLCKATAGARIMFHNLRSSEIANQVTQGTLDLGIVSETRLSKSLTSKPLGKVTFDLCLPLHLIGQNKTKDPIKLMSELPLVSMDGKGEIRLAIEDEFQAKSQIFRPSLEFSSYGLIANALNSKQYCGILPSFFKQQFPQKDFKFLKIQGLRKLTREYVICWNQSILPLKEKTMIGAIDAIEETFKNACQLN